MKRSNQILRVLWYVLLGFIVIFGLGPILWMVSTSLKPESEISTVVIRWIPENLTLENFQAVLEKYAVWRWMFNSLMVALAATLEVVLLSSLTGYALARMEFAGRNFIFLVFLSMLFVPIQITVVPLFLLFNTLGLTDSYLALTLPVGATVTGVFLMRQFFLSIPAELEDAARVDGAGALRIWWSVVMPLARPALLAVSILTFLTTWNSFFWPLIVTRTDASRTLPVGIAQFMTLRPGLVQSAPAYGLSMAGALLASFLPILLFLILQRYFIEGIARTGIKG